MRGWAAESQRIESQQASPRNHDGLIWDEALSRHNENELRAAENAMLETYMAAGNWDAIEEPDDATAPQVEMVLCTCGHAIPRSAVMNASRGTW